MCSIEPADRVGQFLPHPGLTAGVADRSAPGLPAPGGCPQPQQGEAVAHRGDHRVRRVPCGGDGGDDHDAAGPGQGLAAIGPDVAFPAAVIDFADGSQNGGTGVAVGAQDAGEVLDDQRAVVADLAQQAAGCGLLPLLARRGREQCAFAGDGAGDMGTGAGQRLHGLGLGTAGACHDQQPQRIAGQALGCRGGNRGGGGVEVVFCAEPFLEDRVNLGEGLPGRRCLRRLGLPLGCSGLLFGGILGHLAVPLLHGSPPLVGKQTVASTFPLQQFRVRYAFFRREPRAGVALVVQPGRAHSGRALCR